MGMELNGAMDLIDKAFITNDMKLTTTQEVRQGSTYQT